MIKMTFIILFARSLQTVLTLQAFELRVKMTDKQRKERENKEEIERAD